MFRLIRFLRRRDRLGILVCFGLIALQVFLDLTVPDYTQNLTASVSSGAPRMEDVLRNGGMMLLCAMGSMAASIACGFFTARIAARFSMTLREQLFDRITDFTDGDIHSFSVASLITRTTNDVMQMQMFVAAGLQLLIKAPMTAIWAIMKISSASTEWTQATMVAVGIIVVCVGVIIILCYPRFKAIQKLTDNLNAVTEENLSGVRVIRAFNADRYRSVQFEDVNTRITRNHLFTARTTGLLMPLLTLVMSGLTLAIYWIGAYLLNQTPLLARAGLIGSMAAFTQYAIQVVMAFIMLVAIFIIFPRVMVSGSRIMEVLNTSPSITFPGASSGVPGEVTIEFRNVSFAYQDADDACLRDLSFTIQAGKTFAIIGGIGSGKTTLINLIPRLYDVTSGQILLNGREIQSYAQEDLTRMFSLAPQKALLFRGDVKSNVTYGTKEPVADDDPSLLRALRIAQADFVMDLPEGLHSPVAQGGSNFSGGQKQRLSIARAVFRKTPVVLFDDSFSALDYRTDMLVRQALKDELRDTTVILVAQRIGTVRHADTILVLDQGRIAGLGTHEELLEHCPVYRDIALSQLREEELA